jgi:hypothetical protein
MIMQKDIVTAVLKLRETQSLVAFLMSAMRL